MTRKHGNIKQLDGIDDTYEETDEKYCESEHYWKTGQLGSIYQTFLDVNFIIESSNMSEEDKKAEKERLIFLRLSWRVVFLAISS